MLLRMSEEGYLEIVHEQIQAYGYIPVEPPSESPVEALYLNEGKGSDSWKDIVSIMKIQEEGVAKVREASNKTRDAIKACVEINANFWRHDSDRVVCFLLLICPSISEQMEMYVEEGHETLDGDTPIETKTWLYPILVDLNDERLVYRESTGLKKLFLHYVLSREVEKLFQIPSEKEEVPIE